MVRIVGTNQRFVGRPAYSGLASTQLIWRQPPKLGVYLRGEVRDG
jgi:hypothetical protein